MSIKIDLKIFLFSIIFWFTKQIELYAILMIFAFIHELGHLICGLILGFKPNSIKINPFGFQITFDTHIEDYNYRIKKGNELCVKKIIIALAGPVINVLTAILCLMIPNDSIIQKEIIIYANLLLAIFNIIPIYPLDGGRIIKEIINIIKGRKEAYELTSKISKVTIIILTIIVSITILYVHNIALLIILMYLWYLVIKNEKLYKIKNKIYEYINS